MRSRVVAVAVLLVPIACSGSQRSSPSDEADAGGDDAAPPPGSGDDAMGAARDAASEVQPDGGAALGCTAGYTLSHQQPTTCVPYAANPRCLTCKELPGAGIGGPQDHLFPGSDAAASTMVANSTTGGLYRFYGNGGAAQSPFYYATASDPWYRVAPGTCYYEKDLDIAFHAPEGASYSLSGGGDSNLAVWDQAQGLIVEMYVSLAKGATRVLPPASGCGSTATTACELPQSFGGGCGVERPFGGPSGTDQDWGHNREPFAGGQTIGGSSNDFSAWAATTRLAELELGRIVHALQGGYACANPAVGNHGVVFPAQGSNLLLADCTPGVATGQLFFTDYTDAQIAAMNVPKWQKTVLGALSHYGTYLLDTGGGSTNTISPLSFNYGVEGFEAWRFASPGCDATCTKMGGPCDKCVAPAFFGWLDVQTGVLGGEDIQPWLGIPVVDGKGIDGHIHIADPCVAAGMAGAHLGEGGAPAACVGSLWVDLRGPSGDGDGAGTVTSSCSGADCAPISCVGGYCNLTSGNGRSVTLSAVPASGHAFKGWSGACSGSGTCQVTVDGTMGVVQAFADFD